MKWFMKWFEQLKENHLLMMAVCCGLALIVLLVIIYGFGIRNTYITWLAILLCPLSHLLMMNMHKPDKQADKGGKCH